MPELPDLEAYAKNLTKKVSNKEVFEVLVYKPRKLNVSKKDINNALRSAKISKLSRSGKDILIEFYNNRKVSIHLMLEGRFDIVNTIDSVDFRILAFKLNDVYLVISDPREWAKIELDPQDPNIPDALGSDFSIEYFKQKLKEKKAKNIKAFLIDQSIVRGIGNAYVDEILWEAKISPESKAGKLPEDVADRLHQSLKSVLRWSVGEILKMSPDVINGEIRSFMRVHHKEKKTCPNGFSIQTKKIASKTTYYTDEQIIY